MSMAYFSLKKSKHRTTYVRHFFVVFFFLPLLHLVFTKRYPTQTLKSGVNVNASILYCWATALLYKHIPMIPLIYLNISSAISVLLLLAFGFIPSL